MSRNGDADPVRRERAALPELVDEVIALVVLAELEERVALDVRDDRLDVLEELPVLLRAAPASSFLRSFPVSGLFETSCGAGASGFAPAGGRMCGTARAPRSARPPLLSPWRRVMSLTAETTRSASAQAPDLSSSAARARLRRRREKDGLAFEDRPVAVRARRRLRKEEDARVLSERRVLEIGPDLERPEGVRTAHVTRASGGPEAM